MSRWMITLAVLFLALQAHGSPGDPGAPEKFFPDPRSGVRDRWIVVLAPHVRSGRAVAEEMAGRGRVRHVFERVLNGFTAELPEAAARALSHDPRVAYVEEVVEMTVSGSQSAPGWALDRVDTRPRFLDGVYRYGGTGRGVNVYVLDSGISPISELSGRLVAAYDVVTNDDLSILHDVADHGTRVASIIGGTRHGVAKEATVHSVQIAKWRAADGKVFFSSEWTLAGMDWVAARAVRPAVANLCVNNMGSAAPALNDAARALIASGIMLVSSAGNIEGDALAPVTREGLIVGALEPNMDRRVRNTAQGAYVDIFAPGSQIPVSDAHDDPAYFHYTSSAAPFVTGAVAIYLERNPAATPAQVHEWIVGTATAGLVSNISPGTPNRLLYVPPEVP